MIHNSVYTQPLVIRPADQNLEVRVVMEYDANYLRDRLVATVWLAGQKTRFDARAVVPDDWNVRSNTAWEVHIRRLAESTADLALQTFVSGLARVGAIPDIQAQIESLGRRVEALEPDPEPEVVEDPEPLDLPDTGWVTAKMTTWQKVRIGILWVLGIALFVAAMIGIKGCQERQDQETRDRFYSDCEDADGEIVTFDGTDKCVIDGGVVDELVIP